MDLKNFYKTGYDIFTPKMEKVVQKLNQELFDFTNKHFDSIEIKKEFKNAEDFLNNFHKLRISEDKINQYRIELSKYINKDEVLLSRIFKVLEKDLIKIFGPDIVGQKNVGIVIQRPKDTGVFPIHRDAPPNSNHEIVFWIPLVDCFGTKNMSIINKDQNIKVLKMFSENKKNQYNNIQKYYKKFGKLNKIDKGQVLAFWTGLFHYIPINQEISTRWSLNLRFKNLFSPYGIKGYPDYFKLIRKSELTQMTIEHEK